MSTLARWHMKLFELKLLMRFIQCFLITLFALCFSACATIAPTTRVDLHRPQDAAEGLQRYYHERLVPSSDGYTRQGSSYGFGTLPLFYDAQGASLCAQWARTGDKFTWTAALSSLFLLGAGIGISAEAPDGDPAKAAWLVSLMPAGLVGLTFYWLGDGWFRKPSVALYNKQLAERLGMRVDPFGPDSP